MATIVTLLVEILLQSLTVLMTLGTYLAPGSLSFPTLKVGRIFIPQKTAAVIKYIG